MVVRQGIQQILSLPAKFDQIHLLQDPQLMGNRALGQLHALGNISHAQLLLQQKGEDMYPGGIAKGFEQLRDLEHYILVHRPALSACARSWDHPAR